MLTLLQTLVECYSHHLSMREVIVEADADDVAQVQRDHGGWAGACSCNGGARTSFWEEACGWVSYTHCLPGFQTDFNVPVPTGFRDTGTLVLTRGKSLATVHVYCTQCTTLQQTIDMMIKHRGLIQLLLRIHSPRSLNAGAPPLTPLTPGYR